MKNYLLIAALLGSLVFTGAPSFASSDSNPNMVGTLMKMGVSSPKTMASVLTFFRHNRPTKDTSGRKAISFVCLDVNGFIILQSTLGPCIDSKGHTYFLGSSELGLSVAFMGGILYGRYHGTYTDGIRGTYMATAGHSVNSVEGAYYVGAKFIKAVSETNDDTLWVAGPQVGFGGAISGAEVNIF